jgi:hypothetical protein
MSTTLPACSSKDDYTIGDKTGYKEKTQSIQQIEAKNPKEFLSVTAKKKKNLLGQLVINGTILNKAKVAEFKDVELKMKFYSKTGALLEENVEVIYEKLSAGGHVKFKTKSFAAKGTDSLHIEVTGAVAVE